MSDHESIKKKLLHKLNQQQKEAVSSDKKRTLVIAGAGSGKTEVMARRIAWWVGIKNVPKENIVAFTFTERAAEEMKFRIRKWLEAITPEGKEVSIGGMYIGTIHGFCLLKIRELWPDDYHNYDILDEAARTALILREFNGLLGLNGLQKAFKEEKGKEFFGQYAAMECFANAYDQLHEHNCFNIDLPAGAPPYELGKDEKEWCKKAKLITDVGNTKSAKAFAVSAARYYAYLRCRRFFDFSTSQSELIRCLRINKNHSLSSKKIHLVVDEVQDINPVQKELITLLMDNEGCLTAVGDHRQAIYGFRGSKVEIIASLWEQFSSSEDMEVINLQENYRSTPRIIELANKWAETIGKIRSMSTPPMKHGNKKRQDQHSSHIAQIKFENRQQEATWIADAIRILVPSKAEGALHDKRSGSHRGLTLSDVAVLVRSSTDVRTYMQALEAAGIPCVVRAGPDLFSQPEILFLISILAITADCEEFIGSEHKPKSLPSRIASVLNCSPKVENVFREAAKAIRQTGLILNRDVEDRIFYAAQAISKRIKENVRMPAKKAEHFITPRLRAFLTSSNELRRVFPQQIFHMLLSEAEVALWDTCESRGQSALFHLGALSGLITGIETPGWTSVKDYRWQIIGLCQYGAEQGRAEEQQLMVQPDVVSITTIHAAKGLEYAAVFLADVNARRFPSSFAKRKPNLPLAGKICTEIKISELADNDNYDSERRLMYVALTRAERFVFISSSGKQKSKFNKELSPLVKKVGGLVTDDSEKLLEDLKYAPKEHVRSNRMSTSFSDLRYYLECPHDFYLRKVLGFAPTIDQAFGYGRGVHNLMRAIHSDPKKWAGLVENGGQLDKALSKLVKQGLFYLRYTTGKPADNMRQKGVQIASDYIQHYAEELRGLIFEPEKEFETLIEFDDEDGGGVLVSGAIDVIRQDNPPRVTLVDFKSGDPESDLHQKLDLEEMQLQITLYAIAAKKEMEYEPELGLVRYLDAEDASKRELQVPLDSQSIDDAKVKVAKMGKKIRNRDFFSGPSGSPRNPVNKIRCAECDFLGFCGMKPAKRYRQSG